MTEIDINFATKDVPKYSYDMCEIQILDNINLQYNHFFEKFMLKNLPCIIKNVASDWECYKHWIENGTINYKYFISEYGELDAPVADCNKLNYNAHCKTNMKIKDYMSYLNSDVRDRILYLKDWHLKRIMPRHNFYDVPAIFAPDWLNEYAEDHEEDDFMFVYIGPKESWTPLHADVYKSYSWSVNVVGRKKWILMPPGEEDKVKDHLGNLPSMLDSEVLSHIKYFEVIQERGDAIFVPSGWHHQVVNIQDTISVNHNFINACNVQEVWIELQKNLVCVENEIQEFSNTLEFTSQCQLILKSVFGMDFKTFVNFIVYISNKRSNQIQDITYLNFNKFYFGKNLINFDLYIISKLSKLIESHPLYKILYKNDIVFTINSGIHDINKVKENKKLCLVLFHRFDFLLTYIIPSSLSSLISSLLNPNS